MDPDAPPTLASLAQARRRQQAALELLRPIAAVIVLVVVVGSARLHPRPGPGGEGLLVLLALAGFVAGVTGVMRGRRLGAAAQAPFFALLVVSTAMLVWLQPRGPGLVGIYVTVAAAVLRVRGLAGAAVGAVALGALPAAELLAGERSWTAIALNELGIAAFFVIALLARRLREGQEQAERLLVELEQSREARAEAAVLAERQRLAREMHDVLAHSLSGLVLQLEGARLLARDASSELAEAVERSHRLARAGLEEARRAIGTLRDDELPGPERLPALAREFERDTGVPCASEVDGAERDLGSEARLTLYRVAQEALTNVRRHARPERVELRLRYEPDGARLTVEDYGPAPPPPVPADGGGYGLTGMRERASLLGATLEAAPTEAGFRVKLGARMTRVLLADDQGVVREGLATLLGLLPGIEVVGTASDGEEAVELAAELAPEVVLMDLRMPRCDGVEATRRLRERQPDARVVVLTTYADDRSVLDALRAGARGFLTKDAGADEIERAIAAVARGEAAIDPAVQHHLVEAVAAGSPPEAPPAPPALPAGLTPREAEVLALVAEGLSNAEIAARLVVSEATVKSHVNRIFTKTGARDRAQAVTFAYRHGLAS